MSDFFSATAAKIESSAPDILRAPLFGELIERVRGDGRKVVLDLGPARAATVKLFNRFHCRLDIADLATGLAELNSREDPGVLRELAEAMLPARGNEATDVVLCWDLLNYLQRPALARVMDCIVARARSGTLVHALIVYSSKRMPTQPGIYMPCDNPGDDSGNIDRLAILPATGEERESPQYTPDDLRRCMQGYHIERAVLLGNGMQEFLFRIS